MFDLGDFIRRNPLAAIYLSVMALGLGVGLIVAGAATAGVGGVLLVFLGAFLVGFALVFIGLGLFSLFRSVRAGFRLGVSGAPAAPVAPVGGPFVLPPVTGFNPALPISETNQLRAPGGTCVLFSFNPPVADEYTVLAGGLDDLLVSANGGPYTVEVSTKSTGPWQSCTTGSADRATASGTNAWDVPFFGSPWQWVRVCTLGPTNLRAVEDLDY